MTVYLIDKITSEVLQTFTDVLSFDDDYVEYLNNGCRGKTYCDVETEFISDVLPESEM